MPTVNCLRVIGFEHDTANWNESYRKGHRNGKEAYEGLLIYQSTKINYKPPKMTNSTSTDVAYGGAWCNRVAAMQEYSHSYCSSW